MIGWATRSASWWPATDPAPPPCVPRCPFAIHRGFLGRPALADLYADADLFVFPSRTETCGLVVLEAMASGLPVIAANEGGVRENLRTGINGLALPGGDAAAFAAAIEELADRRAAAACDGPGGPRLRDGTRLGAGARCPRAAVCERAGRHAGAGARAVRAHGRGGWPAIACKAWPSMSLSCRRTKRRRAALTAALVAAGHRAAGAESGAVGAAALTEPGLDAVVVDLRAPDLDGAALRAVLDPGTPVPPARSRTQNDVTLRRCCSSPAATSARRHCSSVFPAPPCCTRCASITSSRRTPDDPHAPQSRHEDLHPREPARHHVAGVRRAHGESVRCIVRLLGFRGEGGAIHGRAGHAPAHRIVDQHHQ